MTQRVAKSRSVIAELQDRAGTVRADIEKVLTRSWKAALGVLPAGPRRRVRKLQQRVEKAATNLDRSRQRALKRVEARGKHLVSDVEHRAVDAVKPLVTRLDVASRHDVERLSKRIVQLERRVAQQARHTVAA